MKKGDVWSLKVKDCEGLHPLVIISEIKDAETIEVIPLFSGDENATHRDRLIYPYLYWLLGDDWAAVSLKKEIHVSNLRVYLNTLPEITLKELEKALKKEKCNLPKGVLMIEGLGDEREKFRKELKELFNSAAQEPGVSTIIIKKVKKGWEAVNAIIEEILPAENILQDIGITAFSGISFGSRGNGKSNGLSALSISSDEISIILIVKKSEEGLRVMNITGEIGTIAINTKESTVKCKKIGNTWIPEETVFIEEISNIEVDGRINIKISV